MPKKFGSKLDELAKLEGLGNIPLGRIVGVSGPTANSWIRGKTIPNIEQARGLADHFGVSLDYLIRDDVLEQRPESQGISAEERTILDVIRMLKLPAAEVLERLACRREVGPEGGSGGGPGKIGPIRDETEAAIRRQDEQGKGKPRGKADGLSLDPITSRSGMRSGPGRS